MPQWRENDPPAGFYWNESFGDWDHREIYTLNLIDGYTAFTGPPRTGQATYLERLTILIEWLTANGLDAFSRRAHNPTVNGLRRRNTHMSDRWYVGDAAAVRSTFGSQTELTMAADHEDAPCWACGTVHPRFTFICPVQGLAITCRQCGEAGREYSIDTNDGTFTWCDNCGTECEFENCETPAHPNWRFCTTHGVHTNCWQCGEQIEASLTEELHRTRPGHVVCDVCAENICDGCGEYRSDDSMIYNEEEDTYECLTCSRERLREVGEDSDTSIDDSLEQMPTIPGRESIRKCGIEIEGANGSRDGRFLAQQLHRAGLSTTSSMVGYHDGSYGFAKVEQDSSVDWECVLGPLNPAVREDVEQLNVAVKLIRDAVHNKELGLDMRCGLHIHVSAESVGLEQAYNLSHIFTFLEDILFRLAAARWPSHRSCSGNGACVSIPKHNRKMDFMQNRGGNAHVGRHENHYYALSFQNYFNAMMHNCHCGAVQNGFWDECTCPDLGKCTFEFRLFNTTANTRKITAYLALCQALVAKAMEMPVIKKPEEEFPALFFNKLAFKSMKPKTQSPLVEDWKPRLQWLFAELPLTEEEREAIRYCIRWSDLGIGLTTEEIEEFTASPVIEQETEVVA